MRGLYVANLSVDRIEGICKKIYAQAEALAYNLGDCDILLKNNVGCYIEDVKSHKTTNYSRSVLSTAIDIVQNNHYDVLYIRLMVSSVALVKLMSLAQKRGMKVFYEIPTYPYFAEQFRSSKKKYRAIAKIVLDCIFFPFIYNACSNIVVIRSNTKAHVWKKMIEITNGVKTADIISKSYAKAPDETFRMVTVGTLYPYHGYDRILAGLKQCNEEIDGVPIEFHVVGESDTIQELQLTARKMGLQRVTFHGKKTTEELNEMYDNFDVGLGCLALHRRNADIDTTLKVVEYYCRGIPVVSSGITPLDSKVYTIHVIDNDDPIDIKQIYTDWKNIPRDVIMQISSEAKAKFDWKNNIAMITEAT